MKKQIGGAIVTVLLFLASTQPLCGQVSAANAGPAAAGGFRAVLLEAGEASGGGFMDFIHKLSGPQFYGGGLTLSTGFRRGTGRPPNGDSPEKLRLRLSVAARTSVEDTAAVDPDDAELGMLSFQLTAERALAGPFGIGGGVAAHRYGGDADSFWHFSFPVFAQLRFLKNRRVIPFVGGGFHAFLPFDANDFAPVVVKIDRDEVEWVKFVFAGLELRF